MKNKFFDFVEKFYKFFETKEFNPENEDDRKIVQKSSKKWSGRAPGDPKLIKKAVPGGMGAPRGLPSKKRVCGLSLFWTSKAPGERFLHAGRDPKMIQNRAVERKWSLQDRFFGDSCRFLHFSPFLGQICIDFGRFESQVDDLRCVRPEDIRIWARQWATGG